VDNTERGEEESRGSGCIGNNSEKGVCVCVCVCVQVERKERLRITRTRQEIKTRLKQHGRKFTRGRQRYTDIRVQLWERRGPEALRPDLPSVGSLNTGKARMAGVWDGGHERGGGERGMRTWRWMLIADGQVEAEGQTTGREREERGRKRGRERGRKRPDRFDKVGPVF